MEDVEPEIETMDENVGKLMQLLKISATAAKTLTQTLKSICPKGLIVIILQCALFRFIKLLFERSYLLVLFINCG